MADALASQVPGIEPAGISDLAVAGKKCSGNAQQRKRTHLLHHGTLLCSFDLSQIPRYLGHPPREPDYRRRRPHLDFVTSLDLSISEAKASLGRAWQANEPGNDWPHDIVRTLCEEKYNRPDWHQRR
jgi:lipoate---protein ligase